MSLDVVVNDAAGKPVRGLEPWDFKLLDNDRSSKILRFRSFDNRLREARIVVYSVAPEDSSMGGGPSRSLLYKSFLKGVPTEQQADIGDLA